MTMKTAACAMAVALLAGTAALGVPAAAQRAPMPPNHARMTSGHSQRLFMSAVAVYDAGVRRGRASSSNNAYLRGFRDGASSEAYSSRAYVSRAYAVNPYAGGNAIAPVAGYALYDSAAGYAPVTSGYSSYGVRSVSYGSYGDGYASDRYDAGYVPSGPINVAVAPLAIALASQARSAHWSYCAARYQTFDPASDTFLASDGNRYYCQ